MVALAGLILVGSRTPHQVGRRPNPLFIVVWLTAFVLVLNVGVRILARRGGNK